MININERYKTLENIILKGSEADEDYFYEGELTSGFISVFSRCEDKFPYDKDFAIKNDRRNIGPDSALIEVELGETKNKNRYEYCIYKTILNGNEIVYGLHFLININFEIGKVLTTFKDDVKGGIRDMVVFNMLNKEERNNYMYDPYDANSEEEFLMTKGDERKYDCIFPRFALSQLREFVKTLIEEN